MPKAALPVAAAVAAIGLLVALLWFGVTQRERGSVGPASVPFKRAPEFSLGLFDGSTLRLSEALASGKPVVVNFWASWCVPCRDEAPVLESAARRFGQRVTFVGVNVQDTDADARAFMAQQRLTYANGAGNADSISVAYGMRGIPETYFIAPDGQLVRKWNGPLTADGLAQFLSELEHARAT